MSGGGAKREGEQRIQSGLWADSREPNVGLKLVNHEIMIWAGVGHCANWAPQVPPYSFFCNSQSLKAVLMSISASMDKQLCYLHTLRLRSNIKGYCIAMGNMDESQNNYTEGKKPDQKGT